MTDMFGKWNTTVDNVVDEETSEKIRIFITISEDLRQTAKNLSNNRKLFPFILTTKTQTSSEHSSYPFYL